MTIEDLNINVQIDNETHHLLNQFAEAENKPSAIMAASLIKEAIDARNEDMMLSHHAEARLENVKTWHSHEEAWR